MFSNNFGFQIHNSNFYSVGGDVNLQPNGSLAGQDHHAPNFQALPGSTCRGSGAQRIENAGLRRSERRQTGVAWSQRHGIASRAAPYSVSSRPRRPEISSTGEEAPEPSPMNPRSLIESSVGPVRSFGPQFNRLVLPATAHWNQYPYTSPYPNDPTTVNNISTRPDHNCDSSHPDLGSTNGRPHYPAHSFIDEGHLTSYLRPSSRCLAPPIGGTFITTENVNQIHRHGETGINILHRAVALDALYDSADSFPQPKCHPETRTKMLDDLYQWAIQNSSPRPICWLHGPAGAGKSAIMQTLCQRLQDAGRLGGTFFFKRGHTTRGNAKVLFATLAYQLALNNHQLKPSISQSVVNDPSVVGRRMDVQLDKLITEPYRSLRDSAAPVLLIDGLDECEARAVQVEILRLIGHTVHNRPDAVRFLIASRPEVHIREIFEKPSVSVLLNSVNVEQSFEDVRTYFRDEFARIHLEHPDTMGATPTPWPPPDILEGLVRKSSGYFVYASTVVKFVDDRYFRPSDRLAAVQNFSLIESDAPFEALDELYIQILSGVPVQFRSKLGDILQCAIAFNFELNALQINRLLELKPGEVQLILRGLHSVLRIDTPDVICVYHASFLDFLQDPQRSSIFHIGKENRMNVARAVLKALSDENHWLDDVNDPLAWPLKAHDFVECIAAIPPSADFLPLLRLVNPDFLWWNHITCETEVQKVLNWLMWLKALPNPSLEVIERWQSYLAKSRDVCGCCAECTDDELESRWQEDSVDIARFNEPPTPFDEEEVVRCWIRFIET
ncbi:NACHT domain-containing protein [Mycena venus]|uniref:NACHT domain-containing protein n=1 Tax=Mycena venus TaxID=2733690 RepID=A0A8H6Y5C7_9AGAR|nr:NACHT domain-containing protein [Mycena venus]